VVLQMAQLANTDLSFSAATSGNRDESPALVSGNRIVVFAACGVW